MRLCGYAAMRLCGYAQIFHGCASRCDGLVGARHYRGPMPAVSGPVANWVAGAAARTVARGTARLFAAWCTGSPVPGAADRRCEGVADLAARRARAWQSLLGTDRLTAALNQRGDGDRGLGEG